MSLHTDFGMILKKIFTSGFLHVFSANIVSYLVAFCGSIIYARLMGIHEFGIYTFSYNIISFFLLVNGFGAASGVLQFVSKSSDTNEQLSYLKHSLKLGISFNLILSIGIFIYAVSFNLPVVGSKKILLLMAFFPVGRLYIDVFQAYLRATHNNSFLAKFAISTNLILLISNICGIWLNGLIGFVLSTYIAYLIIILISTYIYKLPNILKIVQVTINKKEFINYSIYATIGNAFSQLVFILDIILLGYIIKDAKLIAIYKVATVIPFALNFIPGIVSTFFYPYFAKNSNNFSYIRRLRRQVQFGMLAFSIPLTLILILTAKPLILFIFGNAYVQSVLPFQIVVFGFWIVGTFRTISGNILASLGKAKSAMWLNVIVVLVNLVVTYYLIRHYSIIGAAIGVLVIYIIASILATCTLNRALARN